MQTIHDPRSIITLYEKIMTSKTKRGKYLPLYTLDPQIYFNATSHTDLAIVQNMSQVLTCKHMERQILSTFSCSAISIQNRLE